MTQLDPNKPHQIFHATHYPQDPSQIGYLNLLAALNKYVPDEDMPAVRKLIDRYSKKTRDQAYVLGYDDRLAEARRNLAYPQPDPVTCFNGHPITKTYPQDDGVVEKCGEPTCHYYAQPALEKLRQAPKEKL